MLVRLLVLTAVALSALDMMQLYLEVTVHGKRAIAPASSLDAVTQGLFRLGSGAYIYPRTSRSLRADTLAPTAPPYTYGRDTFLGYARLNTPLQARILPFAIPSGGRIGRRWNDGNLDEFSRSAWQALLLAATWVAARAWTDTQFRIPSLQLVTPYQEQRHALVGLMRVPPPS